MFVRAGIAQMVPMVERPTEKPGATLTRVGVPDAARDFPPRVNFQCRLSYRFWMGDRDVIGLA